MKRKIKNEIHHGHYGHANEKKSDSKYVLF